MANKPSWNLEQLAQHYVETLRSPPNGHGQHVSPIFGHSFLIIREAKKRFPAEAVDNAFRNEIDRGHK